MKKYFREIKNKIVNNIYNLFFRSLDRNYQLLMRILYKKVGLIENQNLFLELHRLSLQGMNYGNSYPDMNGEYFLIDNLKNIIGESENLMVFDVGANIGEYTIKFKQKHSDAKVFCFEPSKKTFDELRKNTENINGITLINKGVGEKNKEITLYRNSSISALASIYNRNLEHLDLSFDEQEKIEIITLDDYCTNNNITIIDYLKLDVEGNELNAFLGAKKLLSEKRIKSIQFEMGGCNLDSKTSWNELYSILKENYDVYRILKNGITKFQNYSEYDEIYVYANYFAKVKQA